jgi:hypothetical protein
VYDRDIAVDIFEAELQLVTYDQIGSLQLLKDEPEALDLRLGEVVLLHPLLVSTAGQSVAGIILPPSVAPPRRLARLLDADESPRRSRLCPWQRRAG